MVHLQRSVAELKHAWLGDPGDRQQAVSAWSPAPGRSLSQKSAEAVCAAWSEEEVKAAFRSMAKNKAPRKDGLPKELFEFHWDILGKHFMKLVDSFAATATLPTSTKDAVTILLHKKGGRDQLENYRPITLLSFTYKVIARVVADRMKRVLHEVISPEQYGFLPGRRLSDVVGLVADVIEAAKNKDLDLYLLLVNFKKAFDSVSRNFLFTVLERMGFPSRLVDWVRGLHKDTWTSLLINGWMGEAVDVMSGVRQGCPLAPYLFLCAVEPLAQQAAAKKLGLEKGEQWLAYLGYADDTTLVLQGEEQIAEAERLLADFEAEVDGGVGVRDPKIELICLAARRIGLLLTETSELKGDIMLAAADLPLGTDTFIAHVKLLKCWRGKSERWKLACGSFMQTPVGGQKAAAKLWELRLEIGTVQGWAGGVVERAEGMLEGAEASIH
ncbi:unnamed protein product [Closterium sp. Yama58-4]|nr:unnamed protein product [Closterium sp. Yama58-4]